MLEQVSALAGIASFEGDGILISGSTAFVLSQIAGEQKALKKRFPRLPDVVGVAVSDAGKTIMRIGPQQLWIIGTSPEQHQDLSVIPLSSSRSRIKLEGTRARDMLAKCAAIDFHPKVFTPGHFVMTGIHHMPVLIHCWGVDQFDIYILRTFARSLWEVLIDAGHS